MKTKRKTRRALAAAVCLLALAALGLLVWLAVLLVKSVTGAAGPDMRRLENVRAVELSASWSSYFATGQDRAAQEAYLTSTLDEAAAQGANTVLLTGRVHEGTGAAAALFRSSTKDEAAPPLAAAVQESDRFLNRFDPLKLLLQEAKSRGMQVALLATDSTGNPIPDEGELPLWLTDAAKHYKLTVYSQTTGGSLGVRTYTAYSDAPDLLRLDADPGVLAAAYQLNPGRGLILGDLADLVAGGSNAAVLLSYVGGGELPALLEKQIPQTLAIVSPDPSVLAYGDEIFLIGTSDPSQPVTVNGQAVTYQGAKGVWGVTLPLKAGENNYSAVQGGQTVTITVRKGAGGGGAGAARPDGSVPAQWGQKLRVTATLASQLSQYSNDDSIAMTAYKGAVAEVANSVAFTRSNKNTYAYQLQNGSYILAKDCELLSPGTPDAAFTGASHSAEGNVEYLTFTGSGTPLYTHTWEGNVLTLNFYSASLNGQLPADFGFGGATVTSELGEHGFALTFTFNEVDPLWGYHVDYLDDGTTRIALKHQPLRSADPAKPLSGVTVMLDPGHGDTDMGAVGSPDPDFPQEKDLNLAASLAARYRLEQLGATVLMTRDTDVFYELGERVEMLNAAKPDFFIAVHHNSTALNKDATGLMGTECYWFYTEGKSLAENLVAGVTAATGREARGVFYNYFYVTRSNICPAVLLETGFVSSPQEYESCADPQALWAEGAAIAQAVLNTLPG